MTQLELQWEYTSGIIAVTDADTLLNQYGQQGWELVTMLQTIIPANVSPLARETGGYVVVFKRIIRNGTT